MTLVPPSLKEELLLSLHPWVYLRKPHSSTMEIVPFLAYPLQSFHPLKCPETLVVKHQKMKYGSASFVVEQVIVSKRMKAAGLAMTVSYPDTQHAAASNYLCFEAVKTNGV